VPVVNSRDVAEMFEKQHAHVLRDIDALRGHDPNLDDGNSGWFREIRTEHPTIAGRMDRSFDLTRDGFTLLAMDRTGAARASGAGDRWAAWAQRSGKEIT
jgi:Rha family phage regulatory protein